VINPFDPSSLSLIEKAIVAANIGITPMNDGRLIRVPIPELSEERRKDMVKMAGRITEEQRISVRNIRRDANEQIKSMQKNGDITEDDRDAALDQIQKCTDGHIKKMDEMLAAKEKDIMEV
jgi:ribosome recycling factor